MELIPLPETFGKLISSTGAFDYNTIDMGICHLSKGREFRYQGNVSCISVTRNFRGKFIYPSCFTSHYI
jgi:hypothetical protein